MGEEKEKKELEFRFGAYWDERCVPLCDVCYTPLWPEDSGSNYAYCNRCGDSKKLLCDYSGEAITIKEAITLVKAEKEIMEQETEEEKEIFFRYGVYWHKKGEHYEALCPECKKVLNNAGAADLFCNECKKTRPLYIGDGIPITIHKAVELLLKAEKTAVTQECEEETRAIGNGIIISKLNEVLSGVGEMEIMARLYRIDSMNIQDIKNSLSSDIGARLIALSNDVKVCRAFLADDIAETKAEVKYGMTELSRELANAVNDLKELYLPIASSTQNKVAGSALLTCAFLLGGIITFTILSFLGY